MSFGPTSAKDAQKDKIFFAAFAAFASTVGVSYSDTLLVGQCR
jgi:hypothetical protein